jgi:hypothetical protein
MNIVRQNIQCTFEFKTPCDGECIDWPGTSKRITDIASFAWSPFSGWLIGAEIAIDFGAGAFTTAKMQSTDAMWSKKLEAVK